MTKPLYFYNGTTFELVGPTTPQSPIAYQTSAPTAPATGDIWIDSDGDVDTYNRQLTRYYFVATASQTTITGTDANGLTLAYVAGSEAVYVNGALQVRGQDYTATNGTSVVMSSGLAVNDVVEIFAYTAFTVANAYTKSETDGIAAAAPGMRLIVPTSVAVGSGTASIATSGTVTFSGVSSLSLNDVFSTTYNNYRIVWESTVSGADPTVYFRYRVSGSDNTSSSYAYTGTRITSTSYGTGTNDGGGSAHQLFNTHQSDGSFPYMAQSAGVDIINPFATKISQILSVAQSSFRGNAIGIHGSSGLFLNTTSFTGFTVYSSAGTMSGTLSVYGYKV